MQRKINKLTELFDKYLTENNKNFIGLKTAQELVRNSDDPEFQKMDFKIFLESGLIPNSYQIGATNKIWRIYKSQSEEEKMEFEHYKNTQTKNGLIKEKKINFRTPIILVVGILTFIYFIFIKTDGKDFLTELNQDNYNSSESPSGYIIKTTTYGATSKKSLDDMYLYLSNNDNSSLSEALANGEIIEISAGTDVYVVKNHFSYTVVKIAGYSEDIYVVTDHLSKNN